MFYYQNNPFSIVYIYVLNIILLAKIILSLYFIPSHLFNSWGTLLGLEMPICNKWNIVAAEKVLGDC